MIVIDASVFAKLFLDEPDRRQAEALIEHSAAEEAELIAPTLLLYEALSIAIRHDVPFDKILGLLDNVRTVGLALHDPTLAEFRIAEEIAKAGNRGAGYPALGDSIYHAMAINRGGTFVTADRRHVAKAGHFSSVVLLGDWAP